MMKVIEMKVNKHYLIVCRATAKSSFFDNNSEIRLFEHLFARFLKGICKLKKVLYTSKGYVMLIKIADKKSILKAYAKQKYKSKTIKDIVEIDIWRIISEHFRFLGCSYVKVRNSRTGRQGGLFCRKYERFGIEHDEIGLIGDFLQFGFVNLEQRFRKYGLVKNFVFRKTNSVNDEIEYLKEEVKRFDLVRKGYYMLI